MIEEQSRIEFISFVCERQLPDNCLILPMWIYYDWLLWKALWPFLNKDENIGWKHKDGNIF